jgi:hypothetical protein
LHSLKEDGFRWEDFREIFPFGFLAIREGEYAQLVNEALDRLSSDKEQTLLLDLLDAQWCGYVEQLWIAHEYGGDSQRFAGENHFALARLQIGSNIRFERGLPDKDGRRAMMSLGKHETLMDRITGHKSTGNREITESSK